jgi:hypothetical protein
MTGRRSALPMTPHPQLALLQSGMAPTTETGMPAIARSRTIE